MVVDFWGKWVKELEMNGKNDGNHGMTVLGEESEREDVVERRGNRDHGSEVTRMMFGGSCEDVVARMLLRGCCF